MYWESRSPVSNDCNSGGTIIISFIEYTFIEKRVQNFVRNKIIGRN